MNLWQAILSGLVIATVSSFITVQLSLFRFHQEKLWERKYLAYATIMEALARLRLHMDQEIVAHVNDRALPAERASELEAQARRSLDELRLAQAIGTFVISADADRELTDLFKKLDSSEEAATSFGDYLSLQFTAIQSCLDALKELGTRDLRRSAARWVHRK